MSSNIEPTRARPPILQRTVAVLVLIAVAAFAIHVVIGVVMTIFWIAMVVAVIAAVGWALKTLL
jgi:hypothetical protein